ncbi:molybdenum cofactor biosynthesis protein MoeB [Nibricoccus aquaticus]|uniref:Molybdopterin-synthase adenylyltransferase n=1 Tax=Nibricoccus aquaticus TaxID=2576891 RepID=A0A290QAU3_9BACT|nr:molybdopterin-synthase adenylyltransferase MoeB [Nibricoccus aquaticus]ATC65357.1 molybdenum cofactor biosynthesis protein MoeB [Nibricoccus aquaticus]
MSAPLPTLSPAELARYSRHILLDEIGVEGQRKLAAAKVLIVGAGGLGSPAALYLAAAGVGTIGIADFDRVQEHNLQRQLLHGTSSIGKLKTDSAADRLADINPFVRVVPLLDGVTVKNAMPLFSGYDVIVDGSDNFATRYLNNDAAFLAKKPLVYGSIFKFEGQVAVFDPARGGPCYRCLFPEPPPAGSVPNCGEAGVVGALCGVIGSLQALETIKLIAGFGEPLIGRMLTYDALRQQFNTITLPRDPDCPLCGRSPKITALHSENYQTTCETPAASTSSPSSMSNETHPLEISVEETKRLLETNPNGTVLIDVREAHEVEICRIPSAQHIPMRQIPEHLGDLPADKHLLIHCHHGGRSMRVTEFLRSRGLTAVTNVAGGIDAWSLQIDPTLRRY